MYLAQRKVSTISDQEFIDFVEQKIRQSWIIVNNPYTNWFKRGNLSIEDLQRLTIELVSYENFLYIAQCLKSLYMPGAGLPNQNRFASDDLGENLICNWNISMNHQDFDLQKTQYELLLNVAEAIELDYQDIQPAKALKSSVEFGKKGLIALIGNKDHWIASGASLANEIALSYWHSLYEGIKVFNEQEKRQIPLSLFEVKQAYSKYSTSTVKQEIEYLLTLESFNRQHFIMGVEYFLKEVAEFWEGLCNDYLLRVEKQVIKRR